MLGQNIKSAHGAHLFGDICMIQVPYDLIVEKIQKKSGLAREDVEAKIRQKMDLLAGLISKDGAAHIIANEYGIRPEEQPKGALKIRQIMPGMRDIEVTARVLDIYELREFERKSGSTGKVKSCLAGDETGRTRIVFWGEKVDEIAGLKQDDVVKIKSGYVKENQGRIEVHVGERAFVIINPPGEKVQETVSRQGFVRKEISQLADSDVDIELFGTVVQTYPPTFFEICPQCSRRARQKDGQFTCETHGIVVPAYSCVITTILDDGSDDDNGSGNIRCVFFRNQAEHLIAKRWEDILALRQNPDQFRQIEDDLLGRMLKVGGRVSKNSMFDRLEFIVQRVLDRDPDPKEEIEFLKEQGVKVPQQEKTTADPVQGSDIETIAFDEESI